MRTPRAARRSLLFVAVAGVAAAVAAVSPSAGARAAWLGSARTARSDARAGTASLVGTASQRAGRESIVPFVQLQPSTPAGTSAFVGGPYTPTQVRMNYDLGPLYVRGINGKGRTIGIVDVYGSPTIRHDLAVFDKLFGIPAPPSFKIVEPAGKVPAFNPESPDVVGWALETTLDVEWAHAMAPGASIVLAVTGVDEVEGTSGFAQIVAAEQYLIEHEHVSVISQSFGATEETFATSASLMKLRSAFVLADSRKYHVTVLAATGDGGATSQNAAGAYFDRRVVSWPATDPLVTAVGGTQILLGSAGQQLSAPRVWNDDGVNGSPLATGGGLSTVFSRPSWQAAVGSIVGSKRGVPDISMDASCDPGAEIFATFPGGPGGLQGECGTSLATPLFAGIVALADQLAGHNLGLLNPKLYTLGARKAPGLLDITLGSNTVSIPLLGGNAVVVGYSARKGYDLASGWGTVRAASLVPELAGKRLP
jgi:subtilase family serine protease